MTDEEFEIAFNETLKKMGRSEPILRGWSPGMVEYPVPGMEEMTEELYEESRKFATTNPPAPIVRQEDQYLEFPLYYAKGRRTRMYWARRYEQMKKACELVEVRSFVLTTGIQKNDTGSFIVYQANSFLGLIWVYFKHKIRTLWPKRKPKQRKLPKYDEE